MVVKLIRVAALSAFAFAGASAYGYNQTMYPYTLPAGRQGAALGCVRAEKGMKLELGKWYTNFSVCKDYADSNGIPLVAVWSNQGCIHCWYLDVCFIQDEFVKFQQTEDAGKAIYCFMAGGDEKLDQVGSTAYNWMYTGGGTKLDAYPFVVLWWKAGKVNHRTTGDKIRGGLGMTPNYTPASTKNVIAAIRSAFSAWRPQKDNVGGMFDFEPTEGHRLEAEASTESVTFNLVRDSGVASIVTNDIVKICGIDGKDFFATNVMWRAGETNQTVTVSLKKNGDSLFARAKDGDAAALLITDAAGSVMATNSVTYVDRPASAHNPLWIDERSASTRARAAGSVPELSFGEWTMDMNVATQKVAAAEGEAFTLALVSGSLWCPDCTKTDMNFLAVTNSTGENLFNAWAKSNSVALVQIDVPTFTNAAGVSRNPSLLIREGRALRDGTVKSGLGYLTRKGATDEDANKVLERNHKLVSTPTAHGGFNRAENNSPLRTGVPMFVMLRKDGTVAARLTRWWSVSPESPDNWDAYINRFDEMVEMARMSSEHADDIENNHATTTTDAIAANGGRTSGEISHCDPVDVFKLEGVGGNALQRVLVMGTSDVANAVTVEYFRVVDGIATNVGTSVSGSLAKGVKLENTFTETGDYYVAVKGDANSDDGALGVNSNVKGNFLRYDISSDVVFVPQETRATGNAPTTSDKVVMRLEEGRIYRIDGLKVDALPQDAIVTFASDDGEPLFKALKSGDVELPLSGGNGGSVMYQVWNPGTVGFVSAASTVDEDAGDVSIPLSRTSGLSGNVKVRIVLNEEKTNLRNSDGEAKFAFDPVEILWKEGEGFKTNVVVKVLDDARYDGTGDVVLDMKLDQGAASLGIAQFKLTVTENDERSAGKAAFVGADPFYGKKMTVYSKTGKEGATVYVGRLAASDGSVSVKVKPNASDVTIGGDVKDGVISWENHKFDRKAVKVTGLTAGKSVRLTLASPTDGLAIASASNAVTIVAVAENALEFANAESVVNLSRYVMSSNIFAISGRPSGQVKFKMMSGKIPSGLKVSYDAAENAMAVSGATKAKAGTYEAVYMAQDGNGAGLPVKLTFVVDDPTAAENPDGSVNAGFNASVAVSRTFKDIPVCDSENRRLVGTLQLTVPPKGNLSAKYVSIAGKKVSLSAKNWSGYDVETKTLSASLTAKGGYEMRVDVEDGGSVAIEIDDPVVKRTFTSETDGNSVWGRRNTADAWKGYYTVALPVDGNGVVEDASRNGFAPRGAGYLTLKMDTASASSRGNVTWAGMLPNGTSVSGSAVLTHGEKWALLPILKVSATDVLSALAKIKAGGYENAEARSVLEVDDVDAYWAHVERDADAKADYAVELDVFGGPYDVSRSLAACCQEAYETTKPTLSFAVAGMTSSYGEFLPMEGTVVTVGKSTMVLNDAPGGLTLSLNRRTGVVSGKVRLPYGDGKSVSASWKGILLQGWGAGCSDCSPGGDDVIYRPFVNGSFYFSDLVEYEKSGTSGRTQTRTLKVKRGGEVSLQ